MKIIVARIRKGNIGFGFGVWRKVFHFDGPVWTFAIGPFSIHARFTKDKGDEE